MTSHPRPGQLQLRPLQGGGRPQGGQSAASTAPAGRPPAGRSTAHYQQPAYKGLLARDEAVGAVPIEDAACGHGAGRRGGCRWARAATAYAGAAIVTAAAKGGKRARASF
ncbi:hypothetical protein BHE74_00054251 [Ensete ventricosum]|nr:hypothetical protein BHE74_00054251 [Ensete ventricosum]